MARTTLRSKAFNGNDYIISNLTIDNTGNGRSGLFYKLSGGTVQNVRLINANVSGYHAGGIVGAINNKDGTLTYTMPESNSVPQFIGLPVIAGLTFDAINYSYIIDSA